MTPPPSPLTGEAPREPLAWRLGVFCGYLLLGAVFTWPMLLQLGDAVIQKGTVPVDAGQGVWNLWWARAALLSMSNPFVTGHLFYPLVINLFYQTLSLPNALLVLPVLLAAGPVAAFNVVTLCSFGLGGYWAYRFARAVVDHRPAALLAGFVFAFTPYHVQRVWSGPMELIAVQWLPLYGLLLLRALARRTAGHVIAAALALLVTALASQYYGLYAAVYTAVHTALAAMLAPRGTRLLIFGAGASIGVVWATLLLPAALLAGGLGGVALEDWYMRQVYHSVAFVDLIVPNIQHPLWGEAAAAWQGQVHPFGLETGAGLGLGVTLLCLLALRRAWREAWPWGMLALLCLLLAMGPQLRLTAAESRLPGPFLLLNLVEIFRNSSRPAIFVAVMLLPVTALAALGLATLRRPATGHRPLVLLLTGLVLFEAIVAPWPLMKLRAAPGAAMNGDPVSGAVLELPPRLNDSRGLLNQICHGRPLLGGYLARLPPYPIVSYPSAIRALWLADAPSADIIALSAAGELASLGVRFVSLDLTELPRGDQARLRQWLDEPGVSRLHLSETREIYQVDPAAARPTLVLGAGWHAVETDGVRSWRWMADQAELTLLTREQAAVLVTFRATAYASARSLELRQGDRLLHALAIPAAPYDRTVELWMLASPGATTLTLSSPAVAAPDGRDLSLSVSEVTLTTLPVKPLWASSAQLPIPPTIPGIITAPCT